MKIYITLLIIIGFVLYTNRINAKVITVFNRLDLTVSDYTTIQLAYDNASSGDTIMVYPSETPYAGIDISKKIILIGSGFTSTPDMPATIISGRVNFLTGSEGSVIESFGGDFNININSVNNITIIKNSFINIVIENSFNTLLAGNALFSHDYTNITSIITVKGNSLVESSNNIISGTNGWGNQFNISNAITIEGTSAMNIINSIVENGTAIQGGSVNIKNSLIYGRINDCTTNFYCSIYRDLNSYTDFYGFFIDFFKGDFHLATGSPAIGTGENGTDMGIYGGANPFVDGGDPSLPIIYYLDVPLIGSQKDGINVTIKAKTNK